MDIYIGKFVNTHGIKGEIRILSDVAYKKEIFQKGNKLYIGKNKTPFIIQNYRVHKNYDMIITNPPIRAGKKIVNDIVIGGASHLNENGNLWCVIQKKHGAQSLIKAMKEVYSAVEVVNVVDEYCIIKAQK